MSSYSMVISNCIDTQRWKSLTRNLSIFVRQMSFEDFFCYRHVAGDMILGKIVESKEFLTHGGLVDKTPSPLSFSFVLSTFAFALSLVDWSLCRLSLEVYTEQGPSRSIQDSITGWLSLEKAKCKIWDWLV